ncbi:MAG: SAM-dependent chlorinase/fluorinase [Thermoguttaceae bacterium]|nr:SAM-dependent chlorinase/fluorinase [Thermoguttaceae bacterium]
MRKMRPTVAILTDFQTGNFYTAQMEGVLCSRAPEVRVIRVTDAVLPQNVLHGAFILAQTVPFFPEETIHIAVVDPGVGSQRELVCAVLNESWKRQRILCPNNGILSLFLEQNAVAEAFLLENPVCFRESVSSTFHGRDVLAPTAAFLANGGLPEALGRKKDLETLIRLEFSRPRLVKDADSGSVKLLGEVLFADSFGNLVTNITPQDLPFPFCGHALLGETRYHPARTYADFPSGTPVVLFGSQGALELALVNGNLAETLNAVSGTPLCVELKDKKIKVSKRF